MSNIERYDVSEEWAHSGIIKAGDFCYLSYCVGNIGGTIEEQINGAFDHMEQRLKLVNNGSMKDYSIVGVKGGKPCKSDFERCVGCKE